MIILRYASKTIATIFLLLSMVACANTPSLNTYELDDEIIIGEKDVLVSTDDAIKPSEEIAVIEEHEKVLYTEEEKPYEKFSTANEYWKNALKHLQNGNEDEAKWALEQALVLSPDNKIAKNLLNQIKMDAINELGVTSFEYKIQPGDSLSKIAKNYLKDPLKFYLLAKYNDIANPSHLMTGRIINIPGVKPEEQVSDTSKPMANSQLDVAVVKSKVDDFIIVSKNKNTLKEPETTVIEKAAESFSKSDYVAVINLLEDSKVVSDTEPKAVSMLVSSYYEIAQLNIKEGNIQEAKYSLLKAAEIEPDNAKVNMALIDMDEVSETEVLFEKSITALASDNVIEANNYLVKVLELNPYHKRAKEKQKEITAKLIPQYYKNALAEQRKQNLDEAIELWDEVLALDENNENAKIYRSKAVGLKMKLEQFASK